MPMNDLLAGKRFCVAALGCRTNLYEAEAAASSLESCGAICVDDREGVDVAVVMTCAVTGAAGAKCRKLIRRLRRDNPCAAIAACGCWAQSATSGEARELGVDILIGNRRKASLADELASWFERREFAANVGTDIARDRSWDGMTLDRPRAHTRAFLKVQDGCSRRCSYCYVPAVRGAEVSRDPHDALREAERIAASGCREVVLTGVHLGSYRHGDLQLGDLIAMIASVDGIERIRMGSIEPFAVSDDLLESLASCGAFCRHLHIPMQSGDDTVLAAMRRGYTAEGFAGVVARARAALGDELHVSTDLIVGFPGESDEAFERSLSLIDDVGIGRVHVFPFSARPGTDAASMIGVVSPDVIRDRAERAGVAGERSLARFAYRFVGVECELLAEKLVDGRAVGWTKNYLRACALCETIPARDAQKISAGDVVKFVPKVRVGGILSEEPEGLDLASGLADGI